MKNIFLLALTVISINVFAQTETNVASTINKVTLFFQGAEIDGLLSLAVEFDYNLLDTLEWNISFVDFVNYVFPTLKKVVTELLHRRSPVTWQDGRAWVR